MNFSFLIFTLLVVKSKCQNKNSTTGGLKWVTFNQWHEMPGGVAENPIVRLSTYGDDICSINHDGCWQGGSIFVQGNLSVTLYGDAKKHHSKKEGHYNLQTDPVIERPFWIQENGGNVIYWYGGSSYSNKWAIEDITVFHINTWPKIPGRAPGILSRDDVGNPLQALTWLFHDPLPKDWLLGRIDLSRSDEYLGGICYVAPLDYDYAISSEFGKNKAVRILVNPGGSVKWKLVDWEYNKGAPPKSAVYIDEQEHCKNVVTAYTDCSDCRPNKLTPSQRTKDGYVYYIYDKKTSYDNNEYKILVEEGIKKYKLISLELEESVALEDVKAISRTSEVINNAPTPRDYEKNLALDVTQSSSWSHSIHWEVGVGLEIGVASVAKYNWSLNAKGGGNHPWGRSETFSKNLTSTARGRVPAKHGVKITLRATQTQKEVPYKAQVEITYDDGTTRTVSDSGTWTSVVVTDFKVIHGDPYPL